MLSEEEEEEDTEVYVEEMAIELVKGAGGFGMDITDVSYPLLDPALSLFWGVSD